MKKITESQLIEQARGLRAYLSDAAVVSGDGTPVISGDGTPVQSGKPAPVAPVAPGANPWEGKDPAKAAAWAKLSPQVQKKLGGADPTDPYIIARMTKGELGGIFGGGATDANPDGTAKAATIPAKANAAADQATTADLAQLKTLIAQLSGGQGAKTPAATAALPSGGTLGKDAKGNPIYNDKDGITYDQAGRSLTPESTTYFLNKLRLMEDAPQTAVMPTTPAAAAPAGDKAAIVKQIQDIMARINSNNENPSPEIIAALGDAQKAIDTANTANTANTPTTPPVVPPNQAAKAPVKAWANGTLGMGSKGPEVSALQKQLGVPESGVFDAATKAAVIKKQTELKVSPDGAWGPTSKAAMAAAKTAAPTPPTTNPAAPTPPTEKPGFFSGLFGGKKPVPTQESVTFSNEAESLARIIDLARR